MAPTVTEFTAPVPQAEFGILKDHLPQSLALFRRLQFTHYPSGTSEHARYLFATDSDGGPNGGDRQGHANPRHFAAAYLDLSKGPETEMYFFSSLEDATDLTAVPDDEVEHVLDLAVALFQRARLIAQAAASSGAYKLFRGASGASAGGVMVGGLHQPTYELLRERRGLTSSYWNPHDVWLFRLDRLPALGEGPVGLRAGDPGGQGLRWDVVRREDVPLIASRTKIPKVEATLMSEPSVGVRDAAEALVAWGFIGVAGTLSTLHVEEPYRGKGMAKAVATKVLREHSFGDDGWSSADVHIDNVQSQGVCKGLGGEKGWRTCWTVIDFDSIP
ncbi:hypothetical protein J7T55_008827 [Diaporthe amygdali]|uniref:uncharacterized protein n=1 Tax=Phomopsis amygdali TaxID=1214568 RepID=UPI0022FE8C82|nr:uncharacterized protein J7T55_008827 [Diaporthe amygdali]KAJ0121660.1 hypothetical protein J7T55_008827 [Diaporthe amygdali]